MKANNRRSGWLGAVIIFILLAIPLASCTPAPTSAPTPAASATTMPAAGSSGGSLTPAGPKVSTPTPIVIKLDGAKTTSTGLQYLEETAGQGDLPKKGELITMNFIATLPDGTELQNTYTQGQPVTTIWGDDRLLAGWEEGIGLMKVGTKARLVLPPSLAFGDQGSSSIPPNSQILLEVELLKSEAAPVPAEVAADKLTKTGSGLQYYELTAGNGEEAVKNSAVSTSYTIWVKTDTGYRYIDSSTNRTAVDFVIGRLDAVFPGWDEGVTGMKVGGKRLLIIPPDLGMGSQANNLIPANSTLVMEVELLKATAPRTAARVDEKDYITTASGLKYFDLTPGTGATPTTGQTVVVHYTGWLVDGTQFDSSIDRGESFSFVIGTGGVIPGWDEGVATMKVGGKRQLVIPSNLGYGDSGAGSVIPPGATLIFEIELLEIK
jgi:peptidylprolyl isomerase